MDEKLTALVDQIAADRTELRKKMLWETDSNACAIMAAYLCASANKHVDAEKYAECKKILKKSVSVFSEFRGIAFSLVATKMALADDAQKYIDESFQVYKKLRSLHKLTASPYMVMASLIIYENGGLDKADENISKLEELYKKLKSEHPMLIWDSDRGFLAMLVTSGLNIDAVVEEIESGYEANKKVALSKDSVHTMAQVLSIVPKPTDAKAQMVKDLIAGFKAAKIPVSKEYGLGAVGALTLLDKSTDEIISMTAEVDAYLKTKKGFKWYSISARQRHMFAQMIVAIAYLPESSLVSSTVVANTIATILVEEVMMMILISTMVANSSASSGGSSN